MRLYFCECGQKMRVEEAKLGLRGHCPGCENIVAVTWENTRPCDNDGVEFPASPTPVEAPAHASQPLPEAAPAPEELERLPFVEESFEAPPRLEDSVLDSGTSLPPLPRFEPSFYFPRVLRTSTPARGDFELLLTSLAAVLQPRKLFAAGVFPVFGALGTIVLVTTILIHPVLYGVLALLWLAGCAGLLTGYMARLVAIEITEHRQARPAEGFGFLGRRFGELFLAFPLIGVAGLLALAVVNGIVFSLASIPGLGPLLGALFALPLFAANWLVFFAIFQAGLIPCIMAVDRCGLTTAMGRVWGRAMRRPGRLLALELATIALTLPAAALLALTAALAAPFSVFAAMGGTGPAALETALIAGQDALPAPVKTGIIVTLGAVGIAWLVLSAVPWSMLTAGWTAAYKAASEARSA